MALLTVTTAPGSFPTAGVVATKNAGAAGGDEFPATGSEMLLVHNNGAAVQDFSVLGVPDASGRDITILQEIPIQGWVLMGPFTKIAGWATQAGRIDVLAETPADIEVIVIRLPAE